MTIKQSFGIIINGNDFDLTELTERINFYYIKGDLTAEDRQELLEAARNKAAIAQPIDSRTEILQLWESIAEIRNRLTALEGNSSSGGEEPADEWPEFVQPTGAHDAYQVGDKITFNNTHYICIIANCIWSPEVYPQGWQEQTT